MDGTAASEEADDDDASSEGEKRVGRVVDDVPRDSRSHDQAEEVQLGRFQERPRSQHQQEAAGDLRETIQTSRVEH